MLDRLDVPLAILSAVAHAVGKPSFESLTTEQRLSALNAALLLQQTAYLQNIWGAMRKVGARD